MKTIKIGSMFNLLATIEAEKGKAKLAKDASDKLIGEFTSLANGEETVFTSESEQKLASVKFQTRASLSAEKLIELGVSAATIQAATVQSAPFAVFRIH